MYRYRSRILRYLIQFYRIGVLICGIFARIYGSRSRISATGFAGFDHRFTFVDTALFATPVILFVGHGPKIPIKQRHIFDRLFLFAGIDDFLLAIAWRKRDRLINLAPEVGELKTTALWCKASGHPHMLIPTPPIFAFVQYLCSCGDKAALALVNIGW